MPDATSTTATILAAYVERGRPGGPTSPAERQAEFFRWLTTHDAEISAETRGDFIDDEESAPDTAMA